MVGNGVLFCLFFGVLVIGYCGCVMEARGGFEGSSLLWSWNGLVKILCGFNCLIGYLSSFPIGIKFSCSIYGPSFNNILFKISK